jgi:hypothetical protein
MVSLLISDETCNIRIRSSSDNDLQWTKLCLTEILIWEEKWDFYDFQQTKKVIWAEQDCFEILYNGNYIPLSKKVTAQILAYFKKQTYQQKFDCHDFIKHITSINIRNVIHTAPYDIFKTKPWSVWIILDQNQDVIHRQIYLWNNFFLWKWWYNWILMVSTKEAMEQLRWWKTLIQIA